MKEKFQQEQTDLPKTDKDIPASAGSEEDSGVKPGDIPKKPEK